MFDPLRFAIEHPFIAFGASVLILALPIMFLFGTAQGKVIWFFVFVVLGLVTAYLLSKRSTSPDDLRMTAKETMRAALMPDKWLSDYVASGIEWHEDQFIFPTRHPSRGIYFSGTLVGREFYQEMSILLDDHKGRFAGEIIRSWRCMLSDAEVDKAMKKGLTLEEALIAGEQAKAHLARVAAKHEEEQEKREFWGENGTRVVKNE